MKIKLVLKLQLSHLVMVLLTATKGQEKSTLEIAGAYKQEDTIEREKCKN